MQTNSEKKIDRKNLDYFPPGLREAVDAAEAIRNAPDLLSFTAQPAPEPPKDYFGEWAELQGMKRRAIFTIAGLRSAWDAGRTFERSTINKPG